MKIYQHYQSTKICKEMQQAVQTEGNKCKLGIYLKGVSNCGLPGTAILLVETQEGLLALICNKLEISQGCVSSFQHGTPKKAVRSLREPTENRFLFGSHVDSWEEVVTQVYNTRNKHRPLHLTLSVAGIHNGGSKTRRPHTRHDAVQCRACD